MRYAVALLLCAAGLRCQQLPLRNYTTADGLAGNTIDRIVRDSRGFLWFCTREGLSRFNGYEFRNFGVDQGLPPVDVDLIETPDRNYWVATREGLARFRPEEANPHFELYRPGERRAGAIQTLATDPAGGLWVGTRDGVYHLDPPHPPDAPDWCLRPVDAGIPNRYADDRFIHALAVDREGTLWIGAHSGLYRRFADGRLEGTHGGLPHPDIRALLADREGRLWAGGWHGVCRILTDRPLAGHEPGEVCPPVPEQGSAVVNTLYESKDGGLWAATESELLRCGNPGDRNLVWSRFTQRNGLPGGGIELLSLGEDLAGNLWVGGFGAIRIASGGLRNYSEPDGLDANHILAVAEDRDGELFALTESRRGRLINRFDGKRFHPLKAAVRASLRYWGWGERQIVLQARNREWWIATGMGAYRFPPVPIERLGETPAAAVYEPANSIFAMFEDARGGVWFSIEVLLSPGGPTQGTALARWDAVTGVWQRFTGVDGVTLTTLATAFAEDRSGAVWIAENNGALLRYFDARFQTVRPLPKPGWIRALYSDSRGWMWVATAGGVTRFDPLASQAAVTYTTADGLASNDVHCIAEDLQGRIYVGTNSGIDRLSLGPPLRIRHYTTTDGLAPGAPVAGFRDRHGSLWFGTRQGLSRLEPEPETRGAAPPVFITGLRVRGAARNVAPLGSLELNGIELGPDQDQIELEFASLRFSPGETLRYQYRLDGDGVWSAPSEQRTVNYAGLQPGSHRWQVRAVTAEGLTSEEPAIMKFTIQPYLWQRWWVRLLAAVLACAAMYAAYRRRVTRLLEVERLRTRIATDLHDDVGSTLSQIAILSEVAHARPPENGREDSLSHIAEISRQLVDSMSDIVWAIDPEQDRLGDLTRRMRRFASDLLEQNDIQVRFEAPAENRNPLLGADVRRHVFLIFKESLHNMVRHAGCTGAEIRLSLAGGGIEMTITDNGKGFEAAEVRRGRGLASMTERAKQLGGTLTLDSRRDCGTSICLRLPLPVRSWPVSPHKWAGTASTFRRILKNRRLRPPLAP